MVKVHKMFCIDAELAESLIGVNGSALVNGLLHTHFDATKLEGKSPKELEFMIEELKIKQRAEKAIKELHNGNK